MRIRRQYIHPTRSFQRIGHPSPFRQQSLYVHAIFPRMLQQVMSGFYGQGIDRPGHTAGTYPGKKFPAARHRSQTQPRHGIAFGHGMQEQYVRQFHRLGYGQHLFLRKQRIRLINDKQLSGICGYQSAKRGGIPCLPRGVIRITQPENPLIARQFLQTGNTFHPMSVQAAGIGIFTKGRYPYSRMTSAKSLGNEVDGFRGSIRHTDFLRTDTMQPGQLSSQCIGLRFRIGTDARQASGQVAVQPIMVHPVVHIRTEIGMNGRIAIGVVSVSVNHFESVFGKAVACSGASAHGRPACCIVPP